MAAGARLVVFLLLLSVFNCAATSDQEDQVDPISPEEVDDGSSLEGPARKLAQNPAVVRPDYSAYKAGNNGGVTCLEYCRGPAWPEPRPVKGEGTDEVYGNCWVSYWTGTSKFFECDWKPPAITGHDLKCYCLAKAVRKRGNNGTVNCNQYCKNQGGSWGTAWSGCVAAFDTAAATALPVGTDLSVLQRSCDWTRGYNAREVTCYCSI